MTEPNKTRAFIAIFSKDDQGFGFGCELLDNHRNEVYHIFSIYLPYAEYPNRRQVLHRIIPTILAEIPSDHIAVTFYATLPQFRKRHELIRKNLQYADGKTIDFREVPHGRKSTISLAIDALERRTSITERF
ncbi:hypothetical protein V7075_07835 [Neobacillus drentensis]|uniref:hypothetical protein n=1 Tax=Neobacillus drentensis TaxID=220684 RepID=UPI002FFE4D50